MYFFAGKKERKKEREKEREIFELALLCAGFNVQLKPRVGAYSSLVLTFSTQLVLV